MDIFYEIYSALSLQAPGSKYSTTKAFQMMGAIPKQPLILDIGCGSGRQKVDIAKLSNGHIIAIDNFEPFFDAVMKRAKEAKLENNIECVKADMKHLAFENEHFDIIWSEGAIYIMGFEKGLANWKKLLKPGGYLAVTEVAWKTNTPPKAIHDYWMANYPAIQTGDDNLRTIENAGYTLINSFFLPNSDWEDYYQELEKRMELYEDHPEAKNVITEARQEIQMFREYKDFYGYEYYIMRKP